MELGKDNAIEYKALMETIKTITHTNFEKIIENDVTYEDTYNYNPNADHEEDAMTVIFFKCPQVMYDGSMHEATISVEIATNDIHDDWYTFGCPGFSPKKDGSDYDWSYIDLSKKSMDKLKSIYEEATQRGELQ